MKRLRRFLTVLLAVNFFCGMQEGMKAENLILVIINGLAVIGLSVMEVKRDGR